MSAFDRYVSDVDGVAHQGGPPWNQHHVTHGPRFAPIPNAMRRSRPISQLLLLLLVTIPLRGQEPGQEEATPVFEEEVSVGYVLVPLVVRSGAGYADRLDENDFRLLVDGQPVKVDSFERRADAPASIVFLQDLSGSMEGTSLQASQQAVQFFLDKSLKGDEFAIATFASSGAGGGGQIEVPYTSEMSVLRESVANWKAWGTTAIKDAVAWVPDN